MTRSINVMLFAYLALIVTGCWAHVGPDDAHHHRHDRDVVVVHDDHHDHDHHY